MRFLRRFFSLVAAAVLAPVLFVLLLAVIASATLRSPAMKAAEAGAVSNQAETPEQRETKRVRLEDCQKRLGTEGGTTLEDCLCLYRGNCPKDASTKRNDEFGAGIRRVGEFVARGWPFIQRFVFDDVFLTTLTILIVSSVFVTIASLFYYALGDRLNGLEDLGAWCVDAPPILGIAGTLYGMVVFFAEHARSADMWLLFFSNFSIAATMTILGAFANVFNHLIWAVLLTHKRGRGRRR